MVSIHDRAEDRIYVPELGGAAGGAGRNVQQRAVSYQRGDIDLIFYLQFSTSDLSREISKEDSGDVISGGGGAVPAARLRDRPLSTDDRGWLSSGHDDRDDPYTTAERHRHHRGGVIARVLFEIAELVERSLAPPPTPSISPGDLTPSSLGGGGDYPNGERGTDVVFVDRAGCNVSISVRGATHPESGGTSARRSAVGATRGGNDGILRLRIPFLDFRDGARGGTGGGESFEPPFRGGTGPFGGGSGFDPRHAVARHIPSVTMTALDEMFHEMHQHRRRQHRRRYRRRPPNSVSAQSHDRVEVCLFRPDYWIHGRAEGDFELYVVFDTRSFENGDENANVPMQLEKIEKLWLHLTGSGSPSDPSSSVD